MIKLENIKYRYNNSPSIYIEITAPRYWWREISDYNIERITESDSLIDRINYKEFTLYDFSFNNLIPYSLGNNDPRDALFLENPNLRIDALDLLNLSIMVLNYYRQRYLDTEDHLYFMQIVQLLPESYNMKRTICIDYDEWQEFCKMVEELYIQC